MKTTLGIILLLIIGITSCDGRKSSNQALSQSIEEFKTKNTIESATYIPESYKEQSQDTILSSGFRIKTKTYTNMKVNVLKSAVRDTITYKDYYREVDAFVTISFNDKLIFEKTITKDFLATILKSEQLKLENTILQSIWVNQDDSLPENSVTITMDYCSITNDNCNRFSIYIDNAGNYIIQTINDQNHI